MEILGYLAMTLGGLLVLVGLTWVVTRQRASSRRTNLIRRRKRLLEHIIWADRPHPVPSDPVGLSEPDATAPSSIATGAESVAEFVLGQRMPLDVCEVAVGATRIRLAPRAAEFLRYAMVVDRGTALRATAVLEGRRKLPFLPRRAPREQGGVAVAESSQYTAARFVERARGRDARVSAKHGAHEVELNATGVRLVSALVHAHSRAFDDASAIVGSAMKLSRVAWLPADSKKVRGGMDYIDDPADPWVLG